jgi:hypothetical protein
VIPQEPATLNPVASGWFAHDMAVQHGLVTLLKQNRENCSTSCALDEYCRLKPANRNPAIVSLTSTVRASTTRDLAAVLQYMPNRRDFQLPRKAGQFFPLLRIDPGDRGLPIPAKILAASLSPTCPVVTHCLLKSVSVRLHSFVQPSFNIPKACS